MDLRTVFVSNIKKYRKEKSMSQMLLAEKCSTSTSYIGEIEIEKKFPSIEMVQKIAEALEIQPYKLFMSKDEVYLASLSPEKQKEIVDKIQKSVENIVYGC